MRNDAINMEVNEGLLVFFAEEEGAVGGVGIGRTLDQGTIGPYIPIGLHPFPDTYTHLSSFFHQIAYLGK